MSLARRLLFIGMALAAPLTVGAKAGDVTLTVATAVPHHRQMYDETTQLLRKTLPNIEVTYLPAAANYDDLAQYALRSALTGTQPDVMYQAYGRVRIMAERELAVPLDALLAAEPDFAALGYDRNSLDACRYKSQLYGIPFSTSTPIVYFNADLVRRAGGDPDHLPADWAGIVALGRKISALDSKLQGLALDYKGDGNWGFLAVLNSLGGTPMNTDETKLLFDGPETLRALQIIHDFGAAGQVDMTRGQWRQSFASGTLGILITTSSVLTEQQKQIAGRFETRTAPIPLEGAKGRVPVGGACAMIFTTDPARQRAAWDYVKFMTGPEAQTIVVRFTGYMPNNVKAIEDPALLGNYYRDNPLQMTAVKQLPVTTGWYAFPGDNGPRISKEIEDILVEVSTLKRDPQEAQKAMMERVTPLLP
ncbi:multiple sugar transport system substrate-binding protein [Angulomicrobium tetraedrale]|uniref:Multiple sugar transport system substrate-binding protein n=1 Tax=Ancylobacter tetraedralis TaxID=217068 RepID=A0A839Z653_9HYPH|nr:ABC transporter substrate-binding protein [Ancylobacter tetraedralis]MBB3769445.1 multiple sugar transport system substrate-binding protein [Ancylobacter tetraedralis]